MSFSSRGDNVRVRPGTPPPRRPDRMAGDRMQTEGTGDISGQVTRPDEKQGFFGSSDVTRRSPEMGEDNRRRPPTGRPPSNFEGPLTDRYRPEPKSILIEEQRRLDAPRPTPDRDDERETPDRSTQPVGSPRGRRGRPVPTPDRGRPPFPPRPTPDRGRPTPDRGRPPFGGGRPTPPRPTPDRPRPEYTKPFNTPGDRRRPPDRGRPPFGGGRPPFGGRTGTRPENMPPRPTGIR